MGRMVYAIYTSFYIPSGFIFWSRGLSTESDLVLVSGLAL